MTGEAKRD